MVKSIRNKVKRAKCIFKFIEYVQRLCSIECVLSVIHINFLLSLKVERLIYSQNYDNKVIYID